MGHPGPAPASAGDGVASRQCVDRPRLVRVAASYRSIELVADPSVDGAFVTGEHTVRRDGEALVVEASSLPFFGDDEEPAGPASRSPTCPRRSPAPATGSTST